MYQIVNHYYVSMLIVFHQVYEPLCIQGSSAGLSSQLLAYHESCSHIGAFHTLSFSKAHKPYDLIILKLRNPPYNIKMSDAPLPSSFDGNSYVSA